MAGMYFGVGNVARKVKNGYAGVTNVARKIKYGYVGVANVARKFYSAAVSPLVLMNNGTTVTSAGMLSTSTIISNYNNKNDGTGATNIKATDNRSSSGSVNFAWTVTYSNWYGRCTRLSDAIDLSGYSKLQFKATFDFGGSNYAKIGVSTSKKSEGTYYNGADGYTYTAEKKFTAYSSGTFEIDISKIEGEAYLYLDQNSCGWERRDDWGSYENGCDLFDFTLIE